jgi:signal transduction histidine kinase
MLSKDFRDFVCAESVPGILEAYERKLMEDSDPDQPKKPVLLEAEVHRSDGSIAIVSASVAFVHDADGRPKSIIMVVRDNTEMTRASEALREANKKLNLLSSITRHDISNQILGLSGQLYLLEQANPGLAKDARMAKAKKSVDRIDTMIRFTKAYENIGVNAPDWFSIRGLVDSATSHTPVGNVRVVNDIPPRLEMYADPLVQSVFNNIIENAVRHGGRTTEVRFSLGAADGGRMIICEDDGDGISPEARERLFEHRPGDEHGVGLFLCREILSITGIIIEEKSEPGNGARFVVTIPASGIRGMNG